MEKRNWTEDEIKQALVLYCLLPFGKMHSRNPNIVELSKVLQRTPSSVAMKLVNFASLDASLQERGVKGLSNASKLDKAVWAKFTKQWTKSVQSFENPLIDQIISSEQIALLSANSEALAITKVRKVQTFFRKAVLSSYNGQCCICKVRHPQLVTASHIIPWSMDKANRANPSNGLCLCAMHDRAFDKGLLSIDDNHRVLISKKISSSNAGTICKHYFEDFEGSEITLPEKFYPDMNFIRFHREKIFSL